METTPIETPLGFINFRDTIFLTSVESTIYPLGIKLTGEIDGTHCSKNIENRKIPFELIFHSVAMFNCFKLDHNFTEKHVNSSFDEVSNSELLKKMSVSSDYKHFIVSTYDYVFEVAAKAYDLILEKFD